MEENEARALVSRYFQKHTLQRMQQNCTLAFLSTLRETAWRTFVWVFSVLGFVWFFFFPQRCLNTQEKHRFCNISSCFQIKYTCLWFQVMLLETSRRYNPEMESITFLKDLSYNRDDFAKAGSTLEKCLFCLSYFSLFNGGFGHSIWGLIAEVR